MLSTRMISLCLANICLIASLLVFAAGFFPHKAFLPGLATWAEDQEGIAREAPFDKVIFMVVDALRSDFVFGSDSHFDFTRGLIADGAAVPFTGHASPPTVTMPRVKGITTGSLPSFLDLVLNFAESDTSSTLAAQDTWLAQIRAKAGGRKLVFYGDDTWLKLFPDFFERSDGTSSFFVSDFTEVDNNVTRHIPTELSRPDWSGMILHYLGLDHIGHKTGPLGPNMPAKQKEMDGIIENIYEAIESQSHLQSCLLVLCGDHGMNEAGNHGGSSYGETSTGLVFVSPKFKSHFKGFKHPEVDTPDYRYHTFVQQSDIAPTLAALLGLPIPLNNLGTIIPMFLTMWKDHQIRIQLVLNNVWQLLRVTQETFPSEHIQAPFRRSHYSSKCSNKDLSDIDDLICANSRLAYSLEDYQAWNIGGEAILDNARDVLQKAQNIMTGAATNYELSKMIIGIGLAALATALALVSCSSTLLKPTTGNAVLLLTSLLHGIMMFASSYVEEEQQFWYWMTSAWLFFIHFKSSQTSPSLTKSISSFTVFALFRISRRWNQTGQKYAGDPDIATTFFRQYPSTLWLLIIATYTYIAMRLIRRSRRLGAAYALTLLSIAPCIVSFIFKLCFTHADAPELLVDVPSLQYLLSFVESVQLDLTRLARSTFSGLLILLVCHIDSIRSSRATKLDLFTGLHDILTLFLITQSRATNIPLFLIFGIQLDLLQATLLPAPKPQGQKSPSTSSHPASLSTTSSILLTTNLLSHASFFLVGNSNSISSIDLSNAYNGITTYNILAVGLLTFLSNWSGPIWWVSASNILLLCARGSEPPSQNLPPEPSNAEPSNAQKPSPSTKPPYHTSHNTLCISTLTSSLSTLAVMTSCYILREHLFIWTVFSPKFLYQAAWVLGFHLGIQGIAAAAVAWGRR